MSINVSIAIYSGNRHTYIIEQHKQRRRNTIRKPKSIFIIMFVNGGSVGVAEVVVHWNRHWMLTELEACTSAKRGLELLGWQLIKHQ